MTAPATSTSTASSAPATAASIAHSSESQWTLVWREFRKRKLAVFSLGVIVLLVTISICAPFLAGDKPLYYVGVNRYEYRESLRTALAVLNNLADARKSAEADSEDAKDSKDKKPHGEKPSVILARQFDFLAIRLSGDQQSALREAGAKTVKVAQTLEAAEGKPTPEAVAEAKSLRADLRKRFDAAAVTLNSDARWPVIASLDWVDITLLAFNIALLLIPAWLPLMRRIVPPEQPGGRTVAGLLILAGLPLLCGGLWKLTVPYRLDRTPYKEGVAADHAEAKSAPVVFERAVWTPIPFALDEKDLNNTFARPELAKYVPEAMLGIWIKLPEAPPKSDDSSTRKATIRAPGVTDRAHWLGTDSTGRDILSRMVWGGRVSLSVGIVATLIEVVLGVLFGAVAGYFRGWVDMLVSRIIEVVICFPTFFLILTIVAFIGPSIYNIMLVIGLTGWTGLARLVRSEFLRLADQEFVLAARALGYTPTRIIFKHVMPNAMAPVFVTATFAVAGAILIESGLSFLNLGITEPTPSWGGILYTGRNSLFSAPWIIFFPGLALFVTITAYNLVGETFRDASDPRLRGRMG